MTFEATQFKFELANSSQTTDKNEFSNFYIISLWELPWQRAVVASVFMLLILTTVFGNALVILSVLTTKRLRTVTNCYVMNLAVTDWLVGTCVMPPSVLFYIVGSWRFGWILCNLWISLDVLLCTASILSLCAISLDRYLAVILPIKYSKRRRTKRLALLMIFVVWVVAFLITCPPIFGWYQLDPSKKNYAECRYNQHKGYVVFSAMGSFFIPLGVMLYVYLRIGFVLKSRQKQMLCDAFSEKSHSNTKKRESDHPIRPLFKHFRSCSTGNTGTSEQVTFFELVEVSTLSSVERCSTLSCGKISIQPPTTIHIGESSSSLSSCMAKIKEECSKNGDVLKHHLSHHTSIRVPMRVSTSRRESKATKTLTTVMGGFIACWLPFFCYYLLLPFLPPKAVFEGLMYFLTWVGWINCAINPFIYAFYNPDFRAAFWRLTLQIVLKKRSS